MKYAIIKTGGKQIKVTAGMPIMTEKIEAADGSSYTFDQVLAIYDGTKLHVGTPMLEGATVKATLQKQGKGKKINILRTKAKSNWARHQGHRQPYTRFLIEEILLAGKSIDKAAAKPAAVKKEAPAKIEAPVIDTMDEKVATADKAEAK